MKLITTLALLGLALPLLADVGTQNLNITNTVTTAATQTLNVGDVIKVDQEDTLGLMFTGQCKESGSTSNLVVTLIRSGDNVTWETQTNWYWNVPVNGANPFAVYTNYSRSYVGTAGYVKVKSIQSFALDDCTNCMLKIIKKAIKAAP